LFVYNKLYWYLKGYDRILDPFAGTGKLRNIRSDAYLIEIEPEWAAINNATIGDALDMPWDNDFFDSVCTSPTYGNRMADNFVDHQKEKKYKRNTYRHALGRQLHENNSGVLQSGEKYKAFHRIAWNEVKRVLKNNGRFILNISNHIRRGVIQDVSGWHCKYLIEIGFVLENEIRVKTKRNRYGENRKVRVEYESVFIFKNLKVT